MPLPTSFPDSETAPLKARWISHLAPPAIPAPPVMVSGAEGIWLWERDGRRIMDFATIRSGALLGHGHSRVQTAMVKQLQRLVSTPGASHEAGLRLMDRLIDGSFADRVHFTNGVASARDALNRLGLRLGEVLGHPERTHIALIEGGPAGSVACEGAVSIPRGDLAALEKALATEKIALVIVEPFAASDPAGEGWQDYIKAVKELCDRDDTALAFDESASGSGRGSELFISEIPGVIPDACILSGALGGGLPFCGLLLSERLAPALPAPDPNASDAASPLACAAAAATLAAIQDDRLLDRVYDTGAWMASKLAKLAERPEVAQVSGVGVLWHIILSSDQAVALANAAALGETGVWVEVIGPNTLRLSPPLIAERGHIDAAIGALGEALDQIIAG